jgi:hypothetical protein
MENVTYPEKVEYSVDNFITSFHAMGHELTNRIAPLLTKQAEMLGKFTSEQIDTEPNKSLYLAIKDAYFVTETVAKYLNESKRVLDEFKKAHAGKSWPIE